MYSPYNPNLPPGSIPSTGPGGLSAGYNGENINCNTERGRITLVNCADLGETLAYNPPTTTSNFAPAPSFAPQTQQTTITPSLNANQSGFNQQWTGSVAQGSGLRPYDGSGNPPAGGFPTNTSPSNFGPPSSYGVSTPYGNTGAGFA